MVARYPTPGTIVHLLSGLAYGGKEQVAIDLARLGILRGQRHLLLLYDTPYRSRTLDLDPSDVPWRVLKRREAGFDFGYPRRLLSAMREEGASLVHAHGATALVYASLAKLIARWKPISVLGTFHVRGIGPTRGSRFALAAATRIADRLFAVSDALARDLHAEGLGRNIETIKNGIDLREFSPAAPTTRLEARRRLALPEENFLIGTLGRLDVVKRQADLVLVAERIRHVAPSARIIVGGDGPLREQLRSRSGSLSNIAFVGPVTDRPTYYAAIDAFVLCSEHEAAPLVLLEAMASGLPVVATAVGGVPELIGSPREQSRVLVPPGDIDRLTAAIVQFAQQHAAGTLDGGENRHRAANFSLEAMFENYARVYQNA